VIDVEISVSLNTHLIFNGFTDSKNITIPFRS